MRNMNYLEEAELQDEYNAKWGDPRRCPRHPHVAVSSPDGMHDGLCGLCEAEADFDDEATL